MAGVDDGYTGEARLTPGFTVGLLEQEPQLDAAKDVHGQRHGRRRRVGAAAGRVRRGAGRLGRPRRRLREARRAAGRPREAKIEAAGAWDLKRTVEIAMDALRLPPGDADVDHAVRRRAAPGRAVPAAAVPPRPAAARRAHQPPRRRVGGVARALPAGLRGHRRGHHPRPLLPRQRGRLDPRARPRPGHPVRGQLLVAGSSRSRPASRQEEKRGLGPAAHARARARVGAHGPEGPPGQGQGPPRRLREAAGRGRRRPRAASTSSRSSSPRATGSATR